MARVASFEYYDNPVAHTGGSTCTINWVTEVILLGSVSVGFAYVAQMADTIDLLVGQNVTDLEVDITRTIYKADGTTVITLNATPNVVGGTITSIVFGTTTLSASKATDLAQGLRDFVVASL